MNSGRPTGTFSGTQLVKDIRGGAGTMAGQGPEFLTRIGSHIYMRADDGVNGSEVWRTDGTTAGTQQLFNINTTTPAISSNAYPQGFRALGNGMVFFATNGASLNGFEPYYADLSAPAPTATLVEINPTGDSHPGGTAGAGAVVREIVTMGDSVYFPATDGTSGMELWKISASNPTVASRVIDLNPGTAASSPSALTVVGSTLYFAADDGVNGVELWKTDGTQAGTELVLDINPGPASSSPAGFLHANGVTYFRADGGLSGIELWRTDGTAAGTTLILDISPFFSSVPRDLVPGGLGVVFRASEDGSTAGVFTSDGTPAGTVRIGDVNVRNDGVLPEFFPANGRVYFRGIQGGGGQTTQVEVFSTDGLTSIQHGDIEPGANGSNPTRFGLVGDQLVFLAGNFALGYHELYALDTLPGCDADLANAQGEGTPDGGVDINDLLYFLIEFELGTVNADLDNGTFTGIGDGGVDVNDLLYFLARFEAGC